MQQLMGSMKTLTIQVPNPPKGEVIIHCLRHAQVGFPHIPHALPLARGINRKKAQHNITSIPRPQRLAILDPPLTSQGRLQAKALTKTLGASPNITHILCSPLKRTVQTALIGLSPLFSTSRKLIAYPDVREWGSSPCSTGSKMHDLLGKMKGNVENVDVDLVEKDWEVNREDKGSLARRERVKRVREDLWKLGQETLKNGGKWKGKDVGKSPGSNQDVEIVVVSHAAFLGTLEGTDGLRALLPPSQFFYH
jgi:broad specificity phosphatase PhoE